MERNEKATDSIIARTLLSMKVNDYLKDPCSQDKERLHQLVEDYWSAACEAETESSDGSRGPNES